MGGAFITSRDIFLNPIWFDITKFRVFFYIVGNAVFSHNGVRIGDLHVKRGQFLRSYRNLSEDLQFIENKMIKKYSVSIISRKINQLVNEGRIEVEETELGTLFTVKNYEIYQGFDTYKNFEHGTVKEQSWNSKGTVLEQYRNNNNNVNKEKKEKKEKKYIIPEQIKPLDIKKSVDSKPSCEKSFNDNKGIPYLEIIAYLNENAKSNYKHTPQKTRDLIKARWEEGFTLEEFKAVINKKCIEWLNDKEMCKYLRPETLFGTKFESYLNQKEVRQNETINQYYEGYNFDKQREFTF